jgi:hypothetical protein
MGPNREPIQLLKQFDEDRSGWLNATERVAALEYVSSQSVNRGPGPGPRGGRFPGGPGFPDFGGEAREPEPGPQLTPGEVSSYPGAPLYDPFTLRTFFLEFESDDWEKELEAFRGTDVEVVATLEVDGQTFRHVGVRFRGNTSYMMAGSGRKRPLNLTLDSVHPRQEFEGYRTLNLLNAHGDPTLMRSVLFYEIARQYIPAPKANFVRLVINGECWGIYANIQQFDSRFARDFFGTPKGARWKVPGSPGGRGGLAYLGDEIDPYRQIYELKSKEDPKAWVGLILLCQTLAETPTELLESALAPVLDVDGVLRFLALDNVLVNSDGFWVRASDYCIYQDAHGQFHILPYDANETFTLGGGFGPLGGGPGPGGPGGVRPSRPFGPGERRGPGDLANRDWPGGFGGPGGFPVGARGPGGGPGRGPGSGGVELDPLVLENDASRPLASKLLAVPELRARYLSYVRDIAENWLDWEKTGPLVLRYQALIEEDVKADTRKLDSTEEFYAGIDGGQKEKPQMAEDGRAGAGENSLRGFFDRRRAFLLDHAEVKQAAPL